MRKRSKRMLFGVTLLLVVLLAGCGGTQIRTNWAGTNVSGKMAYTYSTFTGIETAKIEVEDGQTLRLDFDVAVTQGSLTLRLVGPDKVNLWEKRFESDETGWFETSHIESGRYTLEAQGEQAGGGFEVTW